MAELEYKITCGHCNQPFLTDTFLQIPLCRECFKVGHRGYSGNCWKCRSDYYSDDEPFAAVKDD